MSGHVQDLLSAYLDGELSPPERAMVEAHLAACDHCASRLEDFGTLDAALREMPYEPPAGYFEAFPARVRERVRGRSEPPRPWRVPVWGWAVAAALILAVVTPLTLTRLGAPGAGPAPAPAVLAESPAAGQPAAGTPGDFAAPRAAGRSRAARDAAASAVPHHAAAPAPSAPDPGSSGGDAEFREGEPPPASFAASPAESSGTPGSGSTASRQLDERAAEWGAPSEDAPAGALAAAGEPARRGAAQAKAPAAPAPRSGELERESDQQARKEKAVAQADGSLAPAPAEVHGRAASLGASPLGDAAADEFARLRARTAAGAATLDAARTLRDDWRSFAARNPAGPRGDEARWQVIEAGWRAYRAGRDERDRGVLARDARTYVERADAAHAERVRAILAELERE